MDTLANKANIQDDVLDDEAETRNQSDETNDQDNGSEDDPLSSLQSTVNQLASQIQRDAKGRYILPEDLSPEMKLAVLAEKRRRDTQSEFTIKAKEKKALDAELTALKARVMSDVKLELTPEQEAELEDLKFSDPEAWRKKMNAIERDLSTKQKQKLEEELGKVSTEILEKDELERRKEVLEEFNQAHPDFQLDDDIIAHDIPPRILKKLETGKVTFEEFLQECYDYSKTGKVVKQDKLNNQPNLSKIGGGSTPDKQAQKEDLILSYSKEVF